MYIYTFTRAADNIFRKYIYIQPYSSSNDILHESVQCTYFHKYIRHSKRIELKNAWRGRQIRCMYHEIYTSTCTSTALRINHVYVQDELQLASKSSKSRTHVNCCRRRAWPTVKGLAVYHTSRWIASRPLLVPSLRGDSTIRTVGDPVCRWL